TRNPISVAVSKRVRALIAPIISLIVDASRSSVPDLGFALFKRPPAARAITGWAPRTVGAASRSSSAAAARTRMATTTAPSTRGAALLTIRDRNGAVALLHGCGCRAHEGAVASNAHGYVAVVIQHADIAVF